jgi:hypothetical protein
MVFVEIMVARRAVDVLDSLGGVSFEAATSPGAVTGSTCGANTEGRTTADAHPIESQ